MVTVTEEVRPPLRGALSRDDILAAGLRIARRSDLASLNMRELARELGVTPMAIYHHFEGKSALIDGIIDRYLMEAAITSHGVSKTDWRPWLKRTFLNIYQSWKDAPGVQPVLGSLSHFGPSLLRIIDETLEVLIKAGLSKSDALRVHSGLIGLTMGYALLRTMTAPTAEASERFSGMRRGEGPLRLSDYPYLQNLAEDLQREAESESIEFELDLMLDSVERLVNRSGAKQG